MAVSTKKQTEASTASELLAVEELKERYHTDAAVFAGTAIMFGWRQGRELTSSEYEKAVEKFKQSAAGRRG